MFEIIQDIILDLAVNPLGFLFGLLGGGGLLGGLLNKGGGGGQGAPKTGPDIMVRTETPDQGASEEPATAAVPRGPREVTPASPAEVKQESFKQQQAKPEPITQQLVDKKTETMAETPAPKPEPTALSGLTDEAKPAKPTVAPKTTSPTDGLLDDAPPAPKPSEDVTTAGSDAVPQVVNQTDEKTPVAETVAGEELGDAPQAKPTEMADQIGKKPPKKLPRVRVPFQSGNPSKQPDMPNQEYTADQGYAFQGSSTPEDMFAPPKYT